MSAKAFAGIPLRCSMCGLPYARVQNGVLIVESRHHGETHVNVVPIITLAELANMVRYDDESARQLGGKPIGNQPERDCA